MINTAPYIRVAEELRRSIQELLGSVGILCRVFARGKDPLSFKNKIDKSNGKYSPSGKMIQDAVGVRVIVYFPEDIYIVEELLRKIYQCDEDACTIDIPDASVFSVTRHNLIFKVPIPWMREMPTPTMAAPVDATFEVQLRTILSEGWHEVEHDLRYKRPDDWMDNDSLSRNLNGVVATLETAEWSMRKIFDDLAYHHYKNGHWEAMLHSALRMRVNSRLSESLCNILDSNKILAKGLFRINRSSLFRNLAKLAPKLPLTLDNIVYLWNFVELGNDEIDELTPVFAREVFAATGNSPAIR
ncbi:hypothetical protein os1_23570 [Comamonadaceae bacterium OS-1]|nr:hypothetical protein os1_23570 [Comamonadaceae bacterium OS-1]